MKPNAPIRKYIQFFLSFIFQRFNISPYRASFGRIFQYFFIRDIFAEAKFYFIPISFL